jgi:phospho-N-acetylmuramoyl-pentapeptide-transferase
MQQPPTIELILENIKPILALGFSGFAMAMLITPIYTKFAFKYQWWKKQRTVAVSGEKAVVFQKLHAEKHKRNIPTMAGLICIIAIASVTILFNLDRNQTWLPLATLLLFGIFGLLDDISNVFLKSDKRGGLTPTTQIIALAVLSAIGSLWFYYKLGYDAIYIPWLGSIGIGILYIPLFIAVVVSTSKAVSITDGLDGLAGGLLSIAFSSYAVICLLQGNYLLAAFCCSVVGVMLAYTWFNIYPARFFMGQTGSTALGAVLGVVAMLTNTVALLPLIGIIFVIEAGSSAIQVASKKILKHKIFLSAPIHHHFEAKGWPETKVTMRFWVLGQVAAVVALLIAALGGFLNL